MEWSHRYTWNFSQSAPLNYYGTGYGTGQRTIGLDASPDFGKGPRVIRISSARIFF